MNDNIEKYISNLDTEISSYTQSIDFESLERAKNIILEAEANNKRVHVTGIGKPSYVAGYIASLLSSTGTPAYFLHGTEAVHGSAGQVLPGDVVIAISNSGQTDELMYSINTVKNNGAKIIGVSGNKESKLALASDVHLFAGVDNEGDSLNKPPRASIVIETITLQLLSLLLQDEKELSPKEYVMWHPGGALGQSIKGDK